VRSRRGDDIIDHCSASDDRDPGSGIDRDVTHGRQIDNHAPSFEHATNRVGLAVADRDCEAMCAGGADRQLNILARLTPCNHRRRMIFWQVVLGAVRAKLQLRMALVGRQQDLALEDLALEDLALEDLALEDLALCGRLQIGGGCPSYFRKRPYARHFSSPMLRRR
jgi:hypothetical protein